MATTIELVRAELIADVILTALVGARIYPQLIPQGVQTPVVVLSLISEIPENSLTGTIERLKMSRLQVDCYAKTYIAAWQVADAADNVLASLLRHDLSAVKENSQDLYDDEAQLHRVSSDYLVAVSP
jgi:hypothetical protein